VVDLLAVLARLRDEGAEVADETRDVDGIGRVTDPEGDRVELRQPA
jgi:predicted enzyme related to lactoylglutathione lyase